VCFDVVVVVVDGVVAVGGIAVGVAVVDCVVVVVDFGDVVGVTIDDIVDVVDYVVVDGGVGVCVGGVVVDAVVVGSVVAAVVVVYIVGVYVVDVVVGFVLRWIGGVADCDVVAVGFGVVVVYVGVVAVGVIDTAVVVVIAVSVEHAYITIVDGCFCISLPPHPHHVTMKEVGKRNLLSQRSSLLIMLSTTPFRCVRTFGYAHHPHITRVNAEL